MSPPERPAKKAPEKAPLDGIDLSVFEEEERKVAGLTLDEEPAKPAEPAAPPHLRPPGTAPPAPPSELQLAAPRPAPLEEAPPATPAEPPAAREEIPPRSPEVPGGERPDIPPAALGPPRHPRPAPLAAPPAAYGAPTFSPRYAPPPYPAVPPYPVYTGYPAPPPVFSPYLPGYPTTVYVSQPLPRPQPSQTAEGLTRVRTGAYLGIAYFALLALHHAFEATTGVTDAPGARTHATLGLQFLSYFLLAGEGVLLALAVGAGVSALYRLREGASELGDPAPPIPRRAQVALALAVVVPVAIGIAGWAFLSSLQRSLPGFGIGTDLGLARLYDNYRLTVLAAAAAQLASAFLVALGLKWLLAHVARLAPRRPLRHFAALFVGGAALNAGLALVLYFAVLAPPTVSSPESPTLALAMLAAGPALSAVALLRLRAFLSAAAAEATRRHKASVSRGAQAP